MAESKNVQEIGLFNIPIGDRQWFAEHVGHHHHHHHHHHRGNETTGDTSGQQERESEPASPK